MTLFLQTDESTDLGQTITGRTSWSDGRAVEERGFAPLDLQVDEQEDGLDRGAGIIVLSTGLEVLHMNRAAWEMSARLDRVLGGQGGDGMTMRGVARLGREIVSVLRARRDVADWARLSFRGMVGAPELPLLIRGHGIPDPEGFERSRILICLDAVGLWGELTAVARHRFNLTVRERNVVRHLVKGWTNKEIANALGITEQTVKEHIKHIMQKTRTTTRTGILSCVLGLIPPGEARADRRAVRRG